MSITPEQIAKANTEHAHQSALFCWAATQFGLYPKLRLMFAIPNGGQRGDSSEHGAAITGGRFKAEGVRSGVPDVFLPIPNLYKKGYSGLFIEMKHPKYKNSKYGGRSEEQITWQADLTAMGYCVVTCYSWIEARNEILKYIDAGTGEHVG